MFLKLHASRKQLSGATARSAQLHCWHPLLTGFMTSLEQENEYNVCIFSGQTLNSNAAAYDLSGSVVSYSSTELRYRQSEAGTKATVERPAQAFKSVLIIM